MATLDFGDKENFLQRAAAINRRVEGITQSNTMAGLLNNNFKKWLSDSAMSPVKLTEELDTNKDGCPAARVRAACRHEPEGAHDAR